MESKHNTFFLITGIILVGLIVGVVLLAVQASNNIKSSNTSIEALTTQATSLQSSLASTNSQIASITDQVNESISTLTDNMSLNNQEVAELNQDLAGITSQISSYNSEFVSINNQLDDLEDSVSSGDSSIASIENQLSTISSQITSLQNTVTSLQSSINSLNTRVSALESAAANTKITLITSYSITQDFNERTLLTTFSPTGTGTLYISGTSSSSTGYIRLYNNTLSTFTDYTFGTAKTITTAVTYGYTYSIYFGNTEPSGTVTATLSAYYTYSSSTYTTLFTSKNVTQNHGTQTTL
ncbi:MAG: hypothetical protein JW967_00350, partial [Dehalococcoidales bacterium]|nr:hypothetical protein [Dehalococcoidales bacterium]